MKKSCAANSDGFFPVEGASIKHKRKPSTHKDKSLKVSQINKENVERRKNIISLITKGRVSVGLYGKAKTSDVISRSKTSLKLPSNDSIHSYDPISVHTSPIINTCDEPSHMEVSPCVSSESSSSSMKEISLRILKGLHQTADPTTVNVNEYRSRIKGELRKILKQSNPVAFSNIDAVIKRPLSDPLPQRPQGTPSHSEELQQQYLYSNTTDNQFVNVLFQSNSDPFLTSQDYDCSGGDLFTTSPFPPPPPLATVQPPLATVQPPLITVQQQQEEQEMGRVDFIDLMEDQSTTTASDILQIQGSVERPRMFPHKLY